MKSRSILVCSFVLVASIQFAVAQQDGSPKLPDQYAEVVLDVQGMI